METLADLIAREGALAPQDAAGWAIRLSKRIEALHAMGVTHGSISAGCILVNGASPKSRGMLVDVRRVANHPAYHSPERATGAGISPADDTWAIAVMVYHALTGQLPFQGETDEALREKILAARPVPVAVYGVDADAMQRVLDSALTRDRSHRTSTVAQLRMALAAAAGDAATAMAIPLEDEDEDDGDDEEDDKTIVRAPLQQTPPAGTHAVPRPAAGAPPPMGPALRPGGAPRPGAAAPAWASSRPSPPVGTPHAPRIASRPSAPGPAPRPSSTGSAPRPGQTAARPSSPGARPSSAAAAPRPGQPMQPSLARTLPIHTAQMPAVPMQPPPPALPMQPPPAPAPATPAAKVIPRHARTVPIPPGSAPSPGFPTGGVPFPGQPPTGSVGTPHTPRSPPGPAQPPAPPQGPKPLAGLQRTMPLSAYQPPEPAAPTRPSDAWRPIESPSRTEAWAAPPHVESPSRTEAWAPPPNVESASRPEAWQPMGDPHAQTPPPPQAWGGGPPATPPHHGSPHAVAAPGMAAPGPYDPRLVTAAPSSTTDARFAATAPTAPPRRSGAKWLAVLGALIFVGLGGAGAFFLLPRLRASGALGAPPATTAPQAPNTDPSTTDPSTTSPDTAPTASASAAPAAAAVPTASCLSSMFPADTWPDEAKRPKLDFVCTERDPRRGAQQLRVEVVRPPGAQRRVSEGMREWAVLGWYELAAFAVIRNRCCDAPEPLVLPPEVANCPSFDAALGALSAFAPRAGTAIGPEPPPELTAQIDQAMADYDKSLRCIIRSGASGNYGSYVRPQGGEDTAFRKTLLRGLAR